MLNLSKKHGIKELVLCQKSIQALKMLVILNYFIQFYKLCQYLCQLHIKKSHIFILFLSYILKINL